MLAPELSPLSAAAGKSSGGGVAQGAAANRTEPAPSRSRSMSIACSIRRALPDSRSNKVGGSAPRPSESWPAPTPTSLKRVLSSAFTKRPQDTLECGGVRFVLGQSGFRCDGVRGGVR